MRYTTIPASEGRSNLARIIRTVDETGNIVVFTVHGKARAALVDMDLLDEFIENGEYGISERELVKRSGEKRVSLATLKRKLNV